MIDILKIENEELEFLDLIPTQNMSLDKIEEKLLDDLLSFKDIEYYWVPVFPELAIFRFMSVDESLVIDGKTRDINWYRPIILINGYQSNRYTWNMFAQQLWLLGFRSIFALEPDNFTVDLQSMYLKMDKVIRTLLSFISIFKTVTLIGHSLGGTIARNYLKHVEKTHICTVSLLITLATPHHGLPKYLRAFEPFFRVIIDPKTVDLFSQKNGILSLNSIYQKDELLNITMVNVQGSMKRLAGGDGTFKPEPVSEMINYKVHGHHFRINKSIKIFNLIQDYLTNNVLIYKIQLNNIDFLSTMILHPIHVFIVINVENEFEQRFPINEELEFSSNATQISYPYTIISGRFNDFELQKKVTISLYRKKLLSNEKLLEQTFSILPPSQEPLFDYQIINNSIVAVNITIVSYKPINEILVV